MSSKIPIIPTRTRTKSKKLQHRYSISVPRPIEELMEIGDDDSLSGRVWAAIQRYSYCIERIGESTDRVLPVVDVDVVWQATRYMNWSAAHPAGYKPALIAAMAEFSKTVQDQGKRPLIQDISERINQLSTVQTMWLVERLEKLQRARK